MAKTKRAPGFSLTPFSSARGRKRLLALVDHVLDGLLQVCIGAAAAGAARRHGANTVDGVIGQYIHTLLDARCPSGLVAQDGSAGCTGAMASGAGALVDFLT